MENVNWDLWINSVVREMPSCSLRDELIIKEHLERAVAEINSLDNK